MTSFPPCHQNWRCALASLGADHMLMLLVCTCNWHHSHVQRWWKTSWGNQVLAQFLFQSSTWPNHWWLNLLLNKHLPYHQANGLQLPQGEMRKTINSSLNNNIWLHCPWLGEGFYVKSGGTCHTFWGFNAVLLSLRCSASKKSAAGAFQVLFRVLSWKIMSENSVLF